MSELQKVSDTNRYRKLAEKAIQYHHSKLWNGNYFIQLPDPDNL